MEGGDRMLRVKVPCRDEDDFWERLADHVAKNGIRIAAKVPHPVGARVQMALEFRDGRTLSGECVVEGHVPVGSGGGMLVRFVKLGQHEQGAAGPRRDDRPAAAPPSLPKAEAPLEQELFGDLPGATSGAPDLDGTTLIGAEVARHGVRLRRIAIGMAIVALAAAVLGTVVVRRLAPDAAAQVAAHVAAADRLMAEGNLVGDDGALERLLAARRILPSDPAATERLSRAADLLERLGARALERGDLAVAAIHLSSAQRAAPDRASIREKLAAVERAKSKSAPRRR